MNMGKYKVGDKFVIEIEGIYTHFSSDVYENKYFEKGSLEDKRQSCPDE